MSSILLFKPFFKLQKIFWYYITNNKNIQIFLKLLKKRKIEGKYRIWFKRCSFILYSIELNINLDTDLTVWYKYYLKNKLCIASRFKIQGRYDWKMQNRLLFRQNKKHHTQQNSTVYCNNLIFMFEIKLICIIVSIYVKSIFDRHGLK